jgi:hypothetical protein
MARSSGGGSRRRRLLRTDVPHSYAPFAAPVRHPRPRFFLASALAGLSPGREDGLRALGSHPPLPGIRALRRSPTPPITGLPHLAGPLEPGMDRGKPHGCFSFQEAVCRRMVTAAFPGAQTERRGAAGPVRGLLGGSTPPAALFPVSEIRSQGSEVSDLFACFQTAGGQSFFRSIPNSSSASARKAVNSSRCSGLRSRCIATQRTAQS